MKENWTQALAGLSPERHRAMEFLYTHLPESDLDCYPVSLFLQFTEHALFLREEVPWCAALEQELFDHYVLFPRINDEDLSFHRKLFYDALWPRIQGLTSTGEMVLEVNRWCHEIASYQLQDERTASPLTVFRNGSGRCGEESAFLTAALRSVGIPARQVYVPRWAHCDDNHAWVEALCNGTWRFLGACEPEPVLDRGWFNSAASRALLVHSRLFGAGSSPLHGELLGREGGVSWYNQTSRYTSVRSYRFRALHNGCPAAGAVFRIQVLNEASFYTIATLIADENGSALASFGVGSIHILASLNGLWAEGDCEGGDISLELAAPNWKETGWLSFDTYAPRAFPVNPANLSAAQRANRAAVLRDGDVLRNRRVQSFCRPYTGNPAWGDLLIAARGNRDGITAFLERDGDPRRELLLRSLTDKDLRDVSEEVLEDHLQNAPLSEHLPQDLYVSCVLCPRVELEPLTPWRHFLRQALSPAEQAAYRADPSALWKKLNGQIHTPSPRTYSNLVWTPAEAWREGHCDQRSLRILYIALLRALGVPARLRALDGAPEFWRNGAFHTPFPENEGVLRLIPSEEETPVYRQNWSLCRWTPSGWRLLSLPGNAETVSLPAGQYRLITSVRLPSGNQFAAKRELEIQAGKTRPVKLYLRPYALTDMLYRQAMPTIPAVTIKGSPIPDLCRIAPNPSLLLWLEEGGEPTEHILNELSIGWQELDALPIQVVFLLRNQNSLRQPTLAKLLEQWRSVQVLLDDWRYDLENVARQLTHDPSTPPLGVVCDRNGQAVYSISGYHVGSVSLLTRVAAYVCSEVNGKKEKGDEFYA